MTSRETRVAETGLTVEEFAALPEEEGYRLELATGRLVREPAPGPLHGRVAVRIASLLHRLGEEQGLGIAFVDTAFTLSAEPATVRAPDVAFVRSERVPEGGPGHRFWELAPDLAVEVVSPSNAASEMQTKALEYLDAGAEQVWVVDPEARTVTVYRSRTEIRILEADDRLEAEDVISDLSLPVRNLFF